MQIEDALRKMLRRAMEESTPPDLDAFRHRMSANPNRALHDGHIVRSNRSWALGLLALSAAAVAICLAWFVAVQYPAGTAAQQALAKAQTLAPLLPALASDDAERRALALVVARQVDPNFAAETAIQLTQWEASQAQAQVASTRIRPYSDRIFEGLQKLQWSRDPRDREVAIWQDLLPVLKEAQKNRDDFINVAIEYRKVLPLLRVKESSPFRESYWGELWIYNILLNSKINPVVESARQTAPPVTVVQQALRDHGNGLSAEKRMAFEEAVLAYQDTLKGLQ